MPLDAAVGIVQILMMDLRYIMLVKETRTYLITPITVL